MIAHAASFRVLNSARDRMSIKTGKTLASMTAWICWRLPAVTLEIVQQASLRMLSVKIKGRLISNLEKTLNICHVKSQGFKERWWIVVEIRQEVVNISILVFPVKAEQFY